MCSSKVTQLVRGKTRISAQVAIPPGPECFFSLETSTLDAMSKVTLEKFQNFIGCQFHVFFLHLSYFQSIFILFCSCAERKGAVFWIYWFLCILLPIAPLEHFWLKCRKWNC